MTFELFACISYFFAHTKSLLFNFRTCILKCSVYIIGMLFINQQKRTAPPGVDAAETVRFSWKVVEPQGQREHDVRVSR